MLLQPWHAYLVWVMVLLHHSGAWRPYHNRA
eukprot:COSAG06_NODE_23867_length_679_cov_1.065517_2_plen_30_part_01